MKGVIVKCLQELVTKDHGDEVWQSICQRANVGTHTMFLVSTNVEDEMAIALVAATAEKLGVSLQQAADVFGEYWVCTFAPKIYHSYYQKATSAKSFLLNMDNVHQLTTQRLADSKPPRFDYEWEDDKTLVMTYHSHRNLIDFAVGLAKGVGKYYNEPLEVTKVDDKRLKIRFP